VFALCEPSEQFNGCRIAFRQLFPRQAGDSSTSIAIVADSRLVTAHKPRQYACAGYKEKETSPMELAMNNQIDA